MQNNTKSEMTYAGFWVRFAAFCIDSVILFPMLLIVRLVMAGVMTVLSGTVFGGNILFHYTLKDVVVYLVQALYFVLFTYKTGATIGKRAMNLRVVNGCGSETPALWNVIYRETIGKFLCEMTVGIGYLIAGFDPEKRGLHDMLCDTQVIYAKAVKVYEKVQKVSPRTEVVPNGYHLTETKKVDIVDEEKLEDNKL